MQSRVSPSESDKVLEVHSSRQRSPYPLDEELHKRLKNNLFRGKYPSRQTGSLLHSPGWSGAAQRRERSAVSRLQSD
ncbi:hypothetical protein PBY51_022878 [Eleginops maclovinus]|nr:hypothetical protein PBY51_022878 [Eleginops maclovinus]